MAEVNRIGFTELKSQSGARTGPYQANIIFVHGLKGHPQLTWEAHAKEKANEKKSSIRPFSRSEDHDASISENVKDNISTTTRVFWPRDFLADDIPEARIWTYGYNADIIGSLYKDSTQNDVSRHGRDLAIQFERDIGNQDPVIFVAHSLGGILVKHALYRSQICCSRTKLVVFLGTPHRSSSIAGWGAIASNMTRLALQETNTDIFRTLEVNGQVFDGIHKRFLEVIQNGQIRIHSFQEARGFPDVEGASRKVVEDFSSELGIGPPVETIESIDANHMDMARCTDKAGSQYRAVAGVLTHGMRVMPVQKDGDSALNVNNLQIAIHYGTVSAPQPNQAASSANQPQSGNQQHPQIQKTHIPTYHIPLRRNPRFIGRVGILEELDRGFFGPDPIRTIALYGLGGAGKTQIALHFALKIKETRPEYSIFWVPALSLEGINQTFNEIAKKLGISRTAGMDIGGRDTRPGFSGLPQAVSDKKDIKELVFEHLRSGRAGDWMFIIDNADDGELVLDSTRGVGLAHHLTNEDNGRVLLTTRSRHIASDFAGQKAVNVEILSATDAQKMFESSLIRKHDVLTDEVPTDDVTAEILSRLTYLPLAITQAASHINQTNMKLERYLELLQGTEDTVASLFSREFCDSTRYREVKNSLTAAWIISFEKIKTASPDAINVLTFISCVEPKNIPRSLLPRSDDEAFAWALEILRGYSFLGDQENNTDITKDTSSDVAEYPYSDGMEAMYDAEMYEMHSLIHTATRIWIEQQDTQSQVLGESTKHLSELFNSLHEDPPKLHQYIPHAVALFERSAGSLAKDLEGYRIGIASGLGRYFHSQGRYREAVDYFREVVRWREIYLPQNDVSKLDAEICLADALSDLAKDESLPESWTEALGIFNRVVSLRREISDNENRTLMDNELLLANKYMEHNLERQALEILMRIVPLYRKTLSETDAALLDIETLLVNALTEEDPSQAIDLMERILRLEEESNDTGSRRVLSAGTCLVDIYQKAGRLEDSIRLFNRLFHDTNEIERTYEYYMLGMKGAGILREQGQHDESVRVVELTLANIKKKDSKNDPTRLPCELILVSLYKDTGKFDEALALAIGIREPGRLNEHGFRGHFELCIGHCYKGKEMPDVAIGYFERGVRFMLKSQGQQDFQTQEAQSILASAYIAVRRYKDAIKLLESETVAWATRSDDYGFKLNTLEDLASAYEKDGDFSEAAKWSEQAVAAQRMSLPEDNEDRLCSEHKLARCYLKTGQISKAISLLEHVVGVDSRALEQHKDMELSKRLLRKAKRKLMAEEKACVENDDNDGNRLSSGVISEMTSDSETESADIRD